MRTVLPEWNETRIIKRFAWFPVQALDEDSKTIGIWLEPYYQGQTATYTMGRFTGWKNDYQPLTYRKED